MTEAGGPDILWIVTTQWRGHALGCAGDPNARTPFLDRFVSCATNYTQAVTPHPFGPFARAALLTGKPSPQNGVRRYFDPLPADSRTIAHALGERGYATGFFGKWHLSARDASLPLIGEAHAKLIVPPNARGGFGYWEGFEGGFLLNDPWLHGSRISQPRKFSGYQSDVVSGRAKEWIRDQMPTGKSQERPPWFAMVSLEAPHPPYDAWAPALARDPNELILTNNVPRGGAIEHQARKELAGYYRHIESTDQAIGALVAGVDEYAGQVGRRLPIIAVTSVHGDMHGAHGLFRKGWPYEESVRVPLLVRFPTDQTTGESTRSDSTGSDDRSVSLLDLFSMTLAWAGNDVRPRSPAGSEISMPSVVDLPYQCDRAWRGVRTKSRKLVVTETGSPWLFFDLENDPSEMTNLATQPGYAREIDALRTIAGI
jgi:arylsulfatase A-like enzyme